jgi:hypothetical protein
MEPRLPSVPRQPYKLSALRRVPAVGMRGMVVSVPGHAPKKRLPADVDSPTATAPLPPAPQNCTVMLLQPQLEECGWLEVECAGVPPCARRSHAITMLADDRLVVHGGERANGTALNDLFTIRLGDAASTDAQNLLWTSVPCKSRGGFPTLSRHAIAPSHDGAALYVYGGLSATGSPNTILYRIVLATNKCERVANIGVAIIDFNMSVVQAGVALALYGGSDPVREALIGAVYIVPLGTSIDKEEEREREARALASSTTSDDDDDPCQQSQLTRQNSQRKWKVAGRAPYVQVLEATPRPTEWAPVIFAAELEGCASVIWCGQPTTEVKIVPGNDAEHSGADQSDSAMRTQQQASSSGRQHMSASGFAGSDTSGRFSEADFTTSHEQGSPLSDSSRRVSSKPTSPTDAVRLALKAASCCPYAVVDGTLYLVTAQHVLAFDVTTDVAHAACRSSRICSACAATSHEQGGTAEPDVKRPERRHASRVGTSNGDDRSHSRSGDAGHAHGGALSALPAGAEAEPACLGAAAAEPLHEPARQRAAAVWQHSVAAPTARHVIARRFLLTPAAHRAQPEP